MAQSTVTPRATAKLVSAVDEAGHEVCVYVHDEKSGTWKTEIPRKTTGRYMKDVLDVFLPAGYPHTVTADYTPYQIYDSLQAFSSAIAGLLSNRAVLQGMGVGDAGSSATGAVLLSVLQESTGRLATILFAHRFGQAIEPECKFYRFLADILNDSAMFLDILTPALPLYPRILALCAAGVLRALCGVAAGAAKASLSAHFAKKGNLAELNAKDGSQETVISLMGMLAGSLFVRLVQGRQAVWAWMFILIGIHLWTNYKAVRAVQMRTLNRQRAQIVLDEYLRSKSVLLPETVAVRERILSWKPRPIVFARTFPSDDLIHDGNLKTFKDKNYLMASSGPTTFIFLKVGATAKDALGAYLEAMADPDRSVVLDNAFWEALAVAGWNIGTGAVETGPAIRIQTK